MALPLTIADVQFPNQNYFCGPFKAPNGAIYVVLQDSGTQSPEVHKCTDFDFPAAGFVVQTTGTDPVLGTGQTQWAYMSGNHIHIAYYEDDGSTNWYYYARFDTSDDSWELADQVIDTWDDKYEPTSPGCSIAYRDNAGGQDPYVCVYNGPAEKIGGGYYQRVSYATDADGAGAWANATNQVDAGGEVDYSGCVAVLGSRPDANGQVVHFFWGVDGTNTHSCRTLRWIAAWNLSAKIDAPDNTDTTTEHRHGAGFYYYDAGTDRVLVIFREVPSGFPYVWMVPEDASGDANGGSDAVYDIDDTYQMNIINSSIVACLAIDTFSGKAYAMYGEVAGDGDDLRRNVDDAPWSSWPVSASVEEEAGTCERISCNIYPRNGSLKLAFVWEDNGTVKYDEYDIGQETAPAWIDALPPQQNYKIGPFSV